jgi:hypothetical protein
LVLGAWHNAADNGLLEVHHRLLHAETNEYRRCMREPGQ